MFNKKEKIIKYREVTIIVPEDKFKNFYKTENGEMIFDLSNDQEQGDFHTGIVRIGNYRGKKNFSSERFEFKKETLSFKIISFCPDENKK